MALPSFFMAFKFNFKAKRGRISINGGVEFYFPFLVVV
jgi:hypothetical protein